jgi:hypothetical protein
MSTNLIKVVIVSPATINTNLLLGGSHKQQMVVLKRTEFNRTKANNNKAMHQQNSKKEKRIKGDAQNVYNPKIKNLSCVNIAFLIKVMYA